MPTYPQHLIQASRYPLKGGGWIPLNTGLTAWDKAIIERLTGTEGNKRGDYILASGG